MMTSCEISTKVQALLCCVPALPVAPGFSRESSIPKRGGRMMASAVSSAVPTPAILPARVWRHGRVAA